MQAMDDGTIVRRRAVLEGLAGCVAVAALSAVLPPAAFAQAEPGAVSESDPRISAERVTISGATGPLKGYVVKPTAPGKYGAVVLVHSRYGLIAPVELWSRRLAAQGYVVFAGDFFSPQGGTPSDRDKATEIATKTDTWVTARDGNAAAAWLRTLPEVNGKIGALGFCFGGTVVNKMAVTNPSLAGVICYYGNPMDPQDAQKITAPLLLHYADPVLDERIGVRMAPFEAALKAHNKVFSQYVYDGAPHAFAHDPNDVSYRAAESGLAWNRSMAFLKQYLS